MIIRIIFFSTTPDDLEKGKKIWDEEMSPLIKTQKGFHKAFRAMAQDEPGGGVMVTALGKQRRRGSLALKTKIPRGNP
ncbi:MAG: hypothetical protein HY787_03855 [Deltaproteobacteria bacterium]|nr:hypothetical protein [Deltaproteobacteria bacterium]